MKETKKDNQQSINHLSKQRQTIRTGKFNREEHVVLFDQIKTTTLYVPLNFKSFNFELKLKPSDSDMHVKLTTLMFKIIITQ